MEDRSGRGSEAIRPEEPATRKPWIRPAVHEMSAGSAEDGKGPNADQVNFS